jgi:hypothetical protein
MIENYFVLSSLSRRKNFGKSGLKQTGAAGP